MISNETRVFAVIITVASSSAAADDDDDDDDDDDAENFGATNPTPLFFTVVVLSRRRGCWKRRVVVVVVVVPPAWQRCVGVGSIDVLSKSSSFGLVVVVVPLRVRALFSSIKIALHFSLTTLIP